MMDKRGTKYDDLQLIKEIGSGSTVAFDQLYRQLYPALFVLAAKLTKSNDMAKDIVSEVFLQLWEGRGTLHHVRDLKAYLYISTRNRTLNYLKSCSLRASEELTEHTVTAHEASAAEFFEALLHTETIRALREAIDSLPPECKKVVELVLQGHSTNEIAQTLGISASAVSHQKARAVRILKDHVFLAFLFILPMTFSPS
jgi:RNA polymerase sigma-70 factor (ECF subfamily)